LHKASQNSKRRSFYVVISAFISPIGFGFYHLKNRVLMGSMHVGLEEVPGGYERMAAFYAERAKGEVG
jgi:2,4-dienoyl-CoA reductase (NADPH2)